jgi:hypothetical protein
MRSAVAEPRTGGAGSESAGSGLADEVNEATGAEYALCFHSLLEDEHGLSFPCDAAGRVDMDTLSDKARDDYLYARTVVGRVFRPPAIRAR